MDLKQILSIAKRKPQKAARSFEVFYSDSFPIEIYKMRHPALDEKEYEYIERNWINPVKKLVGDAIFETQKIFTDGNYSIQTNNETVKEFIESYDIMGFFKNIYWQNIILDSDSVLTYHIKYSEFIEKQRGIELGNEYLPLHPYLVTSENILHKDKTTLVYKVKGEKRNNFVALYYNEDNILTYEHYSYDNIGDKNITPILFWQFDNKSNKRYFRQADGIKIVDDNELVIKSYFSPSESILSTIIIDSVNVGVTKTRTTYPIPVVVGEPCDEAGCNGGKLPSTDKDGNYCTVECHTCEGTGSKSLFSPFNTVHVVRGNAAVGDNTPPAPHVYWVDPPQGALDSTRAEIRENRDIAFDYIGLRYSNSDAKGSETALGKMIDREKTFSTYKMYSQDVAITMQWWFDGWNELMFPLEKDSEITVHSYNNFRTISTAEVNEIFTALQNQNAPQYILINLLRDYYNSIGEIEKFNIVNKYYLYKSDDMIVKKGSLGYYDKTQIVISDNIMKWVDEVVGLNDNEIDKYLREKAKSLMAMYIDSDGGIVNANFDYKEDESQDEMYDDSDDDSLYEQLKKQTEDAGMKVEEIEGKIVVSGSPNELININDVNLPPNKLRETVGGLEGILSVVKSVSTGVYDLEAGANLISSLYAVPIEVAKKWIGTPSIANESELNKAEKLL